MQSLVLMTAALAVAVLPAAYAADAGCWRTHGGLCVQYSSSGCPFVGGWFTWTGCESGHYCCVPPKPAPRQRTPQGNCGRRQSAPIDARAAAFVVGGSLAEAGHWPWLVQISRNGDHHCGGVLIRNDWVLTAGHCFAFRDQDDEFTLHVGHAFGNSSHKQSLGVKRIVVHEKFFQPLYSNDVALVQLNESVRTHELVQRICLPEPGELFENTAAVVAGWGATDPSGHSPSEHLMQVQLPIVSLPECRRLHQEAGRPVYDQNLCAGYRAGGRDSCGGDSGGPLMLLRDGRWLAAGLVSHGDGCANANSPGVYVAVSHFVAWVLGHVTAAAQQRR